MGQLFPRVYDRTMEPLERKKLREIRKSLIGKVEGKVLEIGSGTGANFPFYKKETTVSAVEPNLMMAKRSQKRINEAKASVKLYLVGAEKLPFPDNSFDTAISTLVFCTIPNPLKAFQELRRVLKPGGKLLLLEHVKMDQPLLAAAQDVLTPLWKRLCDGCRLNRNTLEDVTKSGFDVTNVEEHYKGLFLVIQALNKK